MDADLKNRALMRQISPTSLFRGRWLIATLAVLALCALFLRLCGWQLQRLEDRRAANALLLARMEQPALTLDGGALDSETADLRQAVVRGAFDYSQEIVLRNRTYNELPGVHVIVPLRITGAAAGAAILVDCGWIPYELADPEQRLQFQDAVGQVEVRGILRRSQARSSSASPADPPLAAGQPRLDAWHRIDIPRIQEQIPYPLASVFLEEEPTAASFSRRFPRPIPEIELSEGSHLFYAIQWFSFAAILLVGYVVLWLQRSRPPS